MMQTDQLGFTSQLFKDCTMSNLSIATIAAAISESFSAQTAANDALFARFKAELQELNDGLAPTVDCNGRLHAPINGYTCIEGHVFTKGQFIPTDDKGYDDIANLKLRVKGQQFINDLKSTDCKSVSGCTGSSWVGVDGVECANLYLEVARGNEGIVEAAVKLVQDSYGIEVIEHVQDGKVAVTGSIVGFWSKESEYGVQQGFTVRLTDGSVYKGTLPKSLYNAVEGDCITFTGNFVAGSPYFKRPSKASVVKKSQAVA